MTWENSGGKNIDFGDDYNYGTCPAEDDNDNDEHTTIEHIAIGIDTKQITINNTALNRKNTLTVADWQPNKTLFKSRNNSDGSNKKLYSNENITAEDLTEIGDESNMEWPYDTLEDGEDAALEDNTNLRDRENSIVRFLKRNRDNSVMSFFQRERTNTISSIKEKYLRVVRYKHFKKFSSIVALSFFIWLFFTLAFLPRTSLARDFRRFHHSTAFTRQEIYRSFLQSFSSGNDETFRSLVDQFSQSNHLVGDEILTQATFDYLKQNLGLNVKPELFKLENRIYDFDIKLKFIDEDNKEEELSLIEPCYRSCLKNSIGSYILQEHSFDDYSIEGVYVDAGLGRKEDFEKMNMEEFKQKIHVIKRDSKMGLDSQLLNSASYGAIGCVIYNQEGFINETDTLFYHPNETITRDYLIENKNPKVPVIPISFNTAQRLLTNKGKLRMTRERKNRMKTNSNEEEFLITNLYTTIPGIWKNHEIIIGAQRDTFSYNGFNSGHLVFLQLCKGFSELMAKGWKPIKTIRLVSFDGNSLNNFGARNQYLRNFKTFDSSMVFIDISKESITGTKEFHCQTTHLFKEVIEEAMKILSISEDDEHDNFVDNNCELVNADTKSLAYDFFYKKNIPTLSCNFADSTKSFPHNSNYLTKEFIEQEIDGDDYKFHKQLAKFYGILALSLDESEVIPYSTGKFIEDIALEFQSIEKEENANIKYWENIADCLYDLTVIFNSFDLYNKRLLKLAYLDYPWYKGLRKWKLLYKIKNSNNRLFAIKNLFVSSIRKKIADNSFVHSTDKDLSSSYHLLFQPNTLEGGKIVAFGTLKEIMMLNDRQQLVEYLGKLYKDLREIRKFALDAYPV